MKMGQTECSETLAYKTQGLGNYPEESIQHSEHGESLKSRIDMNSNLLCYYAASSCYFLQTFRDNLSVPYTGIKDRTYRLSRNVGKELPLLTA